MESSYIIGGIVIAALATYATRIIPFLVFRQREPSPLIRYIEHNMPLMIMVILVFYALKDVKWEAYPFGFAEIIGVGVATVLHVVFDMRNQPTTTMERLTLDIKENPMYEKGLGDMWSRGAIGGVVW